VGRVNDTVDVENVPGTDPRSQKQDLLSISLIGLNESGGVKEPSTV